MRQFAIVWVSTKSWFRVRGGFVGPLIFLGLMFLIEGSFWYSLKSKGAVGTYDLGSLLLYAFAALTVSQAVAVTGEPDSLAEKIESGELDLLLLRPRSVIRQLLEMQTGAVTARLAFAVPILFILALVNPSVELSRVIFVIPALILAGLINGAMNILIANLAFWFRESYAFVVVKETLFWILSGSLLPLDIFSPSTRWFLEHLPMAYTVFWPVQWLLGRTDLSHVLFGQIITLAVLHLAATVVFRFGVKHYQAFGS